MIEQISATVRIRDGILERLAHGTWIRVFTPPARKLPAGVAIVGRG